MRQVNVLDVHGVESYQTGGHGVDGHLIGTGQQYVLHMRAHGARPGTVASRGAVHDGEQAGMNFFLDGKQVHQRLVNHRMRIVPVCGQQAAEGVLHGSGGGGVDVALDRGQMNDVFTDEKIRYLNALGKDIVQRQHLGLGRIRNPLHIAVAEVIKDRDIVFLEDGDVVIEVLAFEGVGDDGLVLHANQILIAALLQSLDGAFQLPGRGVRARKRVVP